MSRFGLAVLLLLVFALAGTVLWVATREPETVTVVATRTVIVTEPPRPAAEPPRRTRPSGGNRWTSRGTGTVVGTVREYGTDRALAGVPVSLVAGAPGPDRAIEATTGADGTFSIADADAFDGWTLRARAPSPLADAEIASVAVAVGQVTDVGVLYLAPAFAVPGIVVDERGAPVEGADVLAVRHRPETGRIDVLRMLREVGERPATVDRAVSAKDGRFRLTKLVPGTYDLAAQRAGFANHAEPAVVVTPAAAAREIRLVVRKGHAIEGRVVRKEGGPVAGAGVVALPEPRGSRFIDPLTKGFATTDAEGAFRIEGLTAGRNIVAVTPTGEPASISDRVQVPQTSPLEIVLEGDAWLEGRVTGPDDRPVAAAQVLVLSEKARSFASVPTDADGRYAIRGLASGVGGAFVVVAEGFAPFPADFAARMSGRDPDLTLVPGANRRDAKLTAGAVVRGTVRDRETGSGVAAARVELRDSAILFGLERVATTDAGGRYEIRGVPPGRSVVVVAKEGWFQPGLTAQGLAEQALARTLPDMERSSAAPAPVVEVPEGATEVARDVEIARSGSLRGRVTTPDGAPAAGARVALEPVTRGRSEFDAGPFVDVEPRLTGDDGAFALPAPAPGVPVRVAASAPGYAAAWSDAVEGRGGEDVAVADVRLRLPATIEGRVSDAEGRGVEGAEVRWTAAGSSARESSTTTTDAEGRFRAAEVVPGNVAVTVSHPRYLPWSAKPQTAEEGAAVTIDAVLDLGAVVTGTVLGPDGNPVVGATVDLRVKGRPGGRIVPDGAGPRPPVVTGADGTFRAEGLTPGEYTAQARAEGFVSVAPADVAAPAGGVVLRLAQAFTISGVARVRGGGPAPGMDVAARAQGSERGGTVSRGRTGSDGRFELKGLPAGTYDVRVDPDSSRGPRPNVLPGTASGVAAGTTDVTVDLEPGLAIAGTVFRSDGTPAAEGRVSCELARDPERRGRTDGDRGSARLGAGRFEIVGLAAGTFEVTVRVDGHAPRRVSVASGTSGLRIDLTAGGSLRGRVLLADGTPAAGAIVTANSPLGTGSARTDAQGRYEIPHLAEGPTYSIQVRVSAAGQAQRGSAAALVVREGTATDVPDLTCEAAAPLPKAPAPPIAPPAPR